MSYEFQNTLYRNASELCAAIASEWLTDGGVNDDEAVCEYLADRSDEGIADECISNWALDAITNAIDVEYGCPAITWLASRDLTRDDLIKEFASNRAARSN